MVFVAFLQTEILIVPYLSCCVEYVCRLKGGKDFSTDSVHAYCDKTYRKCTKKTTKLLYIGKKNLGDTEYKHRLQQKIPVCNEEPPPLPYNYCELLISLSFSLSILTFPVPQLIITRVIMRLKDAACLFDTDAESIVYMAFVLRCASATYVICMQKYLVFQYKLQKVLSLQLQGVQLFSQAFPASVITHF